MNDLKILTDTIVNSTSLNPAVERWADEIAFLQGEIARHVVQLCRIHDLIPREVISAYANALNTALNEIDIDELARSKQLSNRIFKFVKSLEEAGESSKAEVIREIIKNRMREIE